MVTNNCQWINYPIFISSTFRDMDYERDAIRFDVIPRLNEHYRCRYVHFQAIDLRIGINTEIIKEEEREDYVLDICFSKIDNSRPFFIGLLGDRYGWIPSKKRWEIIVDKLSREKRPLLNNSNGRSVTELEMLYGAIGNNGQYMNRSIFMIRSSDSYSLMPEDIKRNYTDYYDAKQICQNEYFESNKKLKTLKRHIIELASTKKMEDCVCEYELKWNREKNKFEDLRPFSDLLFLRLCAEIDKEIGKTPTRYFTWQGQDNENAEMTASLLVNNSIKTSETDNVIELLNSGCNQILITGKIGMGKSVLLSQCWNYLKLQGCICCIGWIGQSVHSCQMRPIIVRWIQQLSNHYNSNEHELLNKEVTSDSHLYDILYTCINQQKSKGKKVFFFLDGIELLYAYQTNDIYQMWINDDISVILTAQKDCCSTISLYHPHMIVTSTDYLSPKDKHLILQHLEKKENIQLPISIQQQLYARQLTPLEIKLYILLFSQLSIADYKRIRSVDKENEIDKINKYLETIYNNTPSDLSQMAKYVLRTLCDRMQLSSKYESLFELLSASPIGLRESDIEPLFGEEWDALYFHTLTFLLGDILWVDHFTQQWKIRSETIRRSLLPDNSKYIYNQLASSIIKLPDYDYLKRDILVFLLIKAENYKLGKDYLGSYNKYENDNDIKTWLNVSTNLLLSDPNRLDHLKNIVGQMTPINATTFVYYLINRGIDDISKRNESILWSTTLLMNIPIEQLDRRSAYQFAYLFMDAQQSESYVDKFGAKRKKYLQRALGALDYCYKLNPHNHNTLDMYSVALMEMADCAMEEGNYNLFDQLINKAYSLQ